ncbi:MAG: pilus assembly protein PilM [Candidatus Kryptonium sp.]
MKSLVNVSKLFHSAERESYLGFDLGTYSIKVAEVASHKNEIILKGFAQSKTFENTIVNQIINDEQLLKTNIKNLISNFQPGTNVIYLAIPYEITIYGKFSTNNPESSQLIEKQINDEIPYKIEDVYFSYFIMPEKGSFTVYYLVSKKDNIDKIKRIFSDINFKLENIDADFINLHNFLEYLYGPENKLIIDWGNEKVKLYFSNKDTPVYTRELFNLGFKHFKNEIMKNFRLTPDIIDKLIHSPPEDQRKSQIKEVYKEYIKKLAEEIKFGIEISRSKYNLNPEVAYIIGGGARIPNIHKILSELLKLDIKEIKIEKKLRISEHIDRRYLSIINTQGVLAVATAAKEFI